MFENNINQYLKEHGFETFCPKAVLFDMDGVLYKSMPNHAVSWHKSMEHFGIPMTEAEAYQYEGMRGVETIKLKVREVRHEEISDEEAQRLFENVWIYTFGVGALCATRVCHFSEERLSEMLTTEFTAMMMLVKSGKRQGEETKCRS